MSTFNAMQTNDLLAETRNQYEIRPFVNESFLLIFPTMYLITRPISL